MKGTARWAATVAEGQASLARGLLSWVRRLGARSLSLWVAEANTVCCSVDSLQMPDSIRVGSLQAVAEMTLTLTTATARTDSSAAQSIVCCESETDQLGGNAVVSARTFRGEWRSLQGCYGCLYCGKVARCLGSGAAGPGWHLLRWPSSLVLLFLDSQAMLIG